MDDAKRFLRYLVPGAVFGLDATVLLWILRPDWIEQQLPKLAGANGVGFAIAGLLGSGAVGFICSVVHHELHWRPWGSTINHTDCVRGLVSAGRLRVVAMDSAGKESSVDAQGIERDVAWAVLSSMWHSRLAQDPIKSAEPRVASLSDTAHSLGTARVAGMAAFVVALVIAARVSSLQPHGWPLIRFVSVVLIGAATVGFFWLTYRRTGRLTQAVIEQVFADAITRDAGSATVTVQSVMLQPKNRP